MSLDERIYVLTGDLGYGMWDSIRNDFPKRYYNVGSSEQALIGIAVGMALSDKIPLCYSVSSFLIYRPYELIRNYLHHEQIPVKLVGSGRDKDYLSLGFTHWSHDLREILSPLDNIKQYYPESQEPLELITKDFLYNGKPSFLSLCR